jgi:hypothetical protein
MTRSDASDRGGPDAGADQRAQRVRRVAWLLSLLLVTHGSLFPWLFASPASWPVALRQMFIERLWWTGLGDAVGNVLLFVPVGATSLLLGDGSTRPLWLRRWRVMAGSIGFAFVLQTIQLWLPERTAALSDVLWNTVGTAVGLWAAPALRPWLNRAAASRGLTDPVILTMCVLWLAVQCWPLMPSPNLRHAWVAMRPLVRPWHPNPAVVATIALSLAVTLALARGAARTSRLGALLVLTSAGSLLLMQHQVLTPSHVLGWSLGIVLAQLLVRLSPRSTALAIALCAMAGFALGALLPWAWSATPGDFHWVPLWARLQSARVVNTQELAWAMFWCGAFTLAARRLDWPAGPTALGLTVAVLAVEVLQRWQPARVADITVGLIPAFWWWVWRRWPPREH